MIGDLFGKPGPGSAAAGYRANGTHSPSMALSFRIAGVALTIFLAVLQFPTIIASPPRWVVILVALAIVACVVSAEIFTWLGASARDRKLVETTIEEVLRGGITGDEAELQVSETVGVQKMAGTEDEGPVIEAHFIRTHLMPRSVWYHMVQRIFNAAGSEEYEVECDFLHEIFLVNTSDSQVTVKKFVAEVQEGEEWRALRRLDDLTDYQVQTGKDNKSMKDLVSLEKLIHGVPLARGVGYQGWLRFEFPTDSKTLQGKINTRVKIIDAFGKEHGVSNPEPFDVSEGQLVHNPSKVWN